MCVLLVVYTCISLIFLRLNKKLYFEIKLNAHLLNPMETSLLFFIFTDKSFPCKKKNFMIIN